MPAKKGNVKRGKIAAKANSILENEDAIETSEQRVTGNENLDATFLVSKEDGNHRKMVKNGSSKFETCDKTDEPSISGNGNAPDLFVKNLEEDNDAVEKMSSKNTKARPKTISKKNESPRLESAIDDHEDGVVGSSPKRPLDGDSEGESAKEPPVKRNRGKKVPVSKQVLKAKDEFEPVVNYDDSEEVEASPKKTYEEAVEEESLTKRNQKSMMVKKGRKGKEEVEIEKSEEKLTKKKGRPVKELPEKDDIRVTAPLSKATKKRAATKEKPLPEPSTRPIRIRKPVVYEEIDTGNKEDEDVINKKSKKAVTKRAVTKKTDEKTKSSTNGSKKRGRTGEEKSQKGEEGGLSE